jgi:nucleoside-diphosphate kinase
MAIEITVAMIKPDGVEKKLEPVIKGAFLEAELEIIASRRCRISRDQALTITGELKDQHLIPLIAAYLTSGECEILVLRGERAIQKTREIIGVTELGNRSASGLRAIYADDYLHNIVHGSSSESEVINDLKALMPEFLEGAPGITQ